MDGVNDTDVIAGDETTPPAVPAAPAWMTTQSPKLLTKPLLPPSEDVTPLPKTRKPRRTKAQMLADAAARPDAMSKIVDKVAAMDCNLGARPIEIHTSMAAEDTAHAIVRDVFRIPPHVVTTPTDRLAIVACLLALLALSVAIVALVR